METRALTLALRFIPFLIWSKPHKKGKIESLSFSLPSTKKLFMGLFVSLTERELLGIAVFHRRAFFRRWNALCTERPDISSWEERLAIVAKEFREDRIYKLPVSIRFISILNPEYPNSLRELPQPPLGLFVEGELGKGPFVSVVGSRKPTAYSLRLTRACVKNWVQWGYCIVSGGALGIDAEAHRAALDFGGRTLVVLGGGHLNLHPRRHEALFREVVLQGGALVSEYPPHFLPRTYSFPERNRIIAALGEELFLAQAHQKSGSLSTARTSLDLGRDIYVLRPPAGDPNFEGSQSLIESGAYPLTSPEDLRQDTSLPRWHF